MLKTFSQEALSYEFDSEGKSESLHYSVGIKIEKSVIVS